MIIVVLFMQIFVSEFGDDMTLLALHHHILVIESYKQAIVHNLIYMWLQKESCIIWWKSSNYFCGRSEVFASYAQRYYWIPTCRCWFEEIMRRA